MKKQAIALILANGINLLANFLIIPLLARFLSYADNGTYGQIFLINTYFVVLFCLGIGSVIQIFLTENKTDEKKVLSSVLILQFLSGMIGCLSIYLFANYFNIIFNNDYLSTYLISFLPSILSITLSTIFVNYYIFYKKTTHLPFILAFSNLLKIFLVWFVIKSKGSLHDIILVLNVVNISQLIFHLLTFRKYLSFKIDINFKKLLLKVSYPFLLLEVLGTTILYVNGLFVSNFLGVEEFAIFRNGAIEIPFIGLFAASITSVALPTIVAYVKNNEIQEVMKLKRRMSTTIAALTFPILVFCIVNSDRLMTLYLGDLYVKCGVVFGVFSLSALIRINSYADILTIRNKPKTIIIANLFSLVIGILTCFILTKYYGIIGTAFSYVISVFLLSGYLVVATCRELKISVKQYIDFQSVGKILFITILFAIPLIFLVQSNVKSIVICATIYGGIVYFILIKQNLIESTLIPTQLKRIFFKN